MKICFITTFFTRATLPLAQHLRRRGHQCDFYLLADQGRNNHETLDFDLPIAGNKIQRLSKQNSIYKYLDKNINVSIVPYFIVKNRRFLIGYIPFFRNLNIIYDMLNEVEAKQYDMIYIIVNEEHDGFIARELYRRGHKNVVIAYHEVLTCHTNIPKLKDVVNATLWLDYPIVCYSNHTKHTLQEQIVKLRYKCMPNIHTIYFGPFETYKRYDTSIPIIKESYILFIGSIQPYKGISFFYESVRDCGQNLNVKIVVAGSGYDACLESMFSDSRFIVINRFLSDQEFANLTCHSLCIVCPYVSGSQSGITHTAMVFGTPVVATKVGAFPEFVEDGRNGILVDYGNKMQLIAAINTIIESNKQYNYIPEHLNWDNIVNELEILYNSQIKTDK